MGAPLDGNRAGPAARFTPRRHVHRAVPQAAPAEPAATGIDYLGLVAAAREEAAGTGATIDFARLGLLPASDGGQHADGRPNTAARQCAPRRGPRAPARPAPRPASRSRPRRL